jgi:hypothetical protein
MAAARWIQFTLDSVNANAATLPLLLPSEIKESQ